MIINLTDNPAKHRLRADICIAGAGPAGIEIARSLDGRDRTVLLLESGREAFDQRAQELCRFESVGKPINAGGKAFNRNVPERYEGACRIRQFGGNSNMWAGKWKKLERCDVDGKWPIPYDEMERFYEEVAAEYRLPRFEASTPLSRLPGRAKKVENDQRSRLKASPYFEEQSPLNFAQAFRAQLAASGNVTVVLSATVTHLDLDPDGKRLVQIRVTDPTGREHIVRARYFVLACGGWENARLLLASKVAREADGSPPGAHYMDHPKGIYGRLFPSLRFRRLWRMATVDGERGRLRACLGLADDHRQALGLPNHSLFFYPAPAGAHRAYSPAAQRLRMLRAGRDRRSDGSSPGYFLRMIGVAASAAIVPGNWVKVVGNLVFRKFGWVGHFVLMHYLEQLPDPASRVSLSDQTDQLGQQMLRVDWRLSEAEAQAFRRHLTHIRDIFREEGLGRIRYDDQHPNLDFTVDAAHHMGTTRMGLSAGDSVVDQNQKMHRVDNLYVAGSSVFPTCGNANPTFTILALSRRLAHHLDGLFSGAANRLTDAHMLSR